MGPQALDDILSPTGIAIFGASDDPGSVGGIMLRNIVTGGYEGPAHPINPRHTEVCGRPCFASLEALPQPVDLAIAATPIARIPAIIEDCAAHGVRALIVAAADAPPPAVLTPVLVAAASRAHLRLLGPNSLGILRPVKRLNATFSRNSATPGPLAIVSQSGALCTSMLDWASARRVGLSAVVSIGDAADIDFGDVLDALALDEHTQGVLLYVERIRRARSFLSGLRAAARMKPVVVVKSGRHAAPPDADDAFDAALARTGAVRVETVEQLFAAGQLLATGHRVRGSGLAIVTNARGLSVLAADRAQDLGVSLTPLAPTTQEELAQVLPPAAARTNPVDLLADASPKRYLAAVEACLADPHIHGVLVMLAPQAFAHPLPTARELLAVQPRWDKLLLACFVGEEQVAGARALLVERGIPEFPSPEAAVEAFGYLAQHERNHRLLLLAPGPLTPQDRPDTDTAGKVVTEALARGAERLTDDETRRLLGAFGVPMVDQARWRQPQTVELHLRVKHDAVFGPVLRFGLGPSEESPIREHFVGLPPLHSGLVQAMLRGSATELELSPEARLAVERLVWSISELVSTRPELVEVHLVPVLLDERGYAVGSATVLLRPVDPSVTPSGHMAIHPYPSHLTTTVVLKDGARLIVRPIRPEDAQLEAAFVKELSPTSRYFRFMMNLRELTPELLVRFTQIDYDRELALVAIDPSGETAVQVGVARYGMNPDGRTADFALVVADAWQGRGLGRRLLQLLMDAARARGIEELEGEMLNENQAMRQLMLGMGFTISASHDEVQVLRLRRALAGEAGASDPSQARGAPPSAR